MKWSEFTAIQNGTRVYNHYFDQCVALANLYNEDVLGGSFVPVNSAYQWWGNRGGAGDPTYFRSSTPVGGAIVVWNTNWGLGHGHIGVVTSVNANGTFNTMEQNAGTGVQRWTYRYTRNMSNVLGFLVPHKNPATTLASNERQVASQPVKRRQEPTSKSKELDPPLAPHVVGTFDAWVNGEKVEGNSVWFRGQLSGNWFWSGAFTSTSTKGLKDLNVKPLKENERKAGELNIKRRTKPNLTGKEINPQIAPGTVVAFDGWINGEKVEGNSVWFRQKADDWSWSGAFTSTSTKGLKDLNPAPPKPPVVDPKERAVGSLDTNIRAKATTISAVVGSLTAGSKHIIEAWSKGSSVEGNDIWFKLKNGFAWSGAFSSSSTANIPEHVIPAPPEEPTQPNDNVPIWVDIKDWEKSGSEAILPLPVFHPQGRELVLPRGIQISQAAVSENGFTPGREGYVNHVVLHHVMHSNLAVAVKTLNGESGQPTTSSVIKDDQIVEMVNFLDTPWTNGRWKSNTLSETAEICNDKTNSDKPSAQSHESAAWFVARAFMRWDIKQDVIVGVNLFGHKDVSKSPTSCPGELDLEWIAARANEILGAIYVEETPPAPDYSGLEESINALTKVIEALTDLLKKIFNIK